MLMTEILLYLCVQSISLWIFSVIYKDSSIYDRFWGLSHGVILSIAVLDSNQPTLSNLIIWVFISFWGFRLSYSITERNWGKGEDIRYQTLREAHKCFSIKSLYLVFLFQSLLLFVLTLPWIHFIKSPLPFGVQQIIAISLMMCSLLLEHKSEQELKEFKRLRNSHVCNTGLWSLCRHPNYLGEICFWFSVCLYCVNGNTLWFMYSPFLISFIIIFITGIKPLEEHMMLTKAGYRDYCESTPVLVPDYKRLFKIVFTTKL